MYRCMKKRSAHSLGGRRDSSVQRNVDELASRRAVLWQVELPLQLHFAVRGIRSSGLRLCTENCSESQRRCSHRNETSSEDVATTGLCERLDAELRGGQRHDGVYTPVGKSGKCQCEVAQVALRASGNASPGWNPSPGLPCSTSHPLGMSTAMMGLDVFLNSSRTVMKGARAGGLKEKPTVHDQSAKLSGPVFALIVTGGRSYRTRNRGRRPCARWPFGKPHPGRPEPSGSSTRSTEVARSAASRGSRIAFSGAVSQERGRQRVSVPPVTRKEAYGKDFALGLLFAREGQISRGAPSYADEKSRPTLG